ncbi:hypothetical protein PV08_01703 [Exophiala spinifera]|uniref:Uncharacterized protein n=1 Tax=Exophiala spinifera TaxID=91928 RepID=A0A0D2BQA2_9EURO|nr:uncharacterized protein PV08_01703 [Exophiala spinifera]KIW21123.1 hypothetical protein PV08_01703 [Exophiala spinifera]
MPSKKLPPRPAQQKPQSPTPQQKPQTPQSAPKPQPNNLSPTPTCQPVIPDYEVKQSSSVSAQLALQAAKKAYELRQAAYGAADPNAREEILAKAINKEIEAESFGKAAKYTRSGAFQGLAAGAGLGVQPGVTLGKLTGALVGGVVASAGAVVGGGIGSAYGAISGPFWDLGQMASHGVRSIIGDFPNWEATSSQKKALEKMVMGAQQTKVPTQEELEEMRDDDGGVRDQEDLQHWVSDLTSYIPSMPSMPKMPKMPSMPSMPGLWGQSKGNNNPPPAGSQSKPTTASNQSPRPKAAANPSALPKPQHAPIKAPSPTSKSQSPLKADENAPRRKPPKLEPRSTGTTSPSSQSATRRKPPKLETRSKPATANA